jgi:hypothetical protein
MSWNPIWNEEALNVHHADGYEIELLYVLCALCVSLLGLRFGSKRFSTE